MDQRFRILNQAEIRRPLLLMAVALALIFVVQYYELPFGNLLSSLFPIGRMGKFPPAESKTNNTENTSDSVLDGTSNGTHVDLSRNSMIGRVSSSINCTASTKAVQSVDSITVETVPGKGNSSLSSSQVESFPPLGSPLTNSSLTKPSLVDTRIGTLSTTVGVNMSSVGQNATSIVRNKNPKLSSRTCSPYVKVKALALTRMSKKRPSKVYPIYKINKLLVQTYASTCSVRTQRSSKPDRELRYAKSQIINAPETDSKTGLYAPIYRNVSMFERSYELMEKMLKVYIYQEGEKPIFHQPSLYGIYASEGRFMKLLEENKKFITEDPQTAHLYYILFSSHQLQLTLYNHRTHNKKKLIQYMQDYVSMIAAKYPFWNRTTGTDHFLAACHDWAPAETRGRLLNCIRALCNADVGGGFSIGMDVSLPETNIHASHSSIKSLGGNPPSHRPILAFFAGQMHGYVRPILLKYWGNKDPDMKILGPMPYVKGNADYVGYMKSSKYCLCPKGHEVNSPRIVEAIMYECVPVIISDNYVPPFFEVLNWESFAVFVLEKDIPNMKDKLLSIPDKMYMEMHRRVKQVQRHFIWHAEPLKYDLFHMTLHSVWYNRLFQL